MKERSDSGKVKLYLGNCLDVLASLEENSVDSIVTDPPYGLNFMGKKWDYDVPSVEIWVQCFRVLKPGGHLLAFAGTRTQHRMAINIEDAGFEIRDMIAWVYGSGFPKSMNVGKAIDKEAGAEREVIGVSKNDRPNSQVKGGKAFDRAMDKGQKHEALLLTAPATPEAQEWEGWGTALKPALEPITMARKPFKGTVANNVLEHGTGAINIDGCRVGTSKRVPASPRKGRDSGSMAGHLGGDSWDNSGMRADVGRFPANLIHDGSDEVVELFPEAKGAVSNGRKGKEQANCYGDRGSQEQLPGYGDSGSAARFFYCPKANKKDRGEGNNHPTVKPTDLMAYLVRLVTPPGGVVLDPFMGSGSTGKAAILEGLGFVGIEYNPDYYAICESRLIVK